MVSDSALTAGEFDALFDGFQLTVVRLEALPAYFVGGAEEQRIQAWLTGRPRPERNVRTDPWLARIALSTLTSGKQWSRVRVVDEPLTEYQRYQMASYVEAQAVGIGSASCLVPRRARSVWTSGSSMRTPTGRMRW